MMSELHYKVSMLNNLLKISKDFGSLVHQKPSVENQFYFRFVTT